MYSAQNECKIICDKVCQLLATGRRFSPGTPVSSTNKPDRYDITEILLKVAVKKLLQPNGKMFNETLVSHLFTTSYIA